METRASLVDNFNKSEIKKRSTMRIVAIERIWWHGNDNKKGGNQSNLLIKCEMRSMQHQIIHDVIAQSLRWLFVLPLAHFFSLYMELIHAERSHLHHPDDLNTTFIIISNSSDKCGYRDRKQKHYLRCLEIVTLREWGRKRCKFDGKNERQGAIDTSMTITINAVPSRRIQQLTWSASSLECISKWPRRD